jgi:hypothetical protein
MQVYNNKFHIVTTLNPFHVGLTNCKIRSNPTKRIYMLADLYLTIVGMNS